MQARVPQDTAKSNRVSQSKYAHCFFLRSLFFLGSAAEARWLSKLNLRAFATCGIDVRDGITSTSYYNSNKYLSHRARSSRYLPVLEAPSPDPSSSSSNRDQSRKRDGKSKQSVISLSTKRRATMNSRDAAYDEDEMLRRAIEESRETGSLGKRTRDESEEYDSTITNDGQHY